MIQPIRRSRAGPSCSAVSRIAERDPSFELPAA